MGPPHEQQQQLVGSIAGPIESVRERPGGILTHGGSSERAATGPTSTSRPDLKEKLNNFHLYAWIAAQHLERLLQVTGKNLNRESIIYALENGAFDGSWKCSTCVKPTIVTPHDHNVIEAQFMQQWQEAKQAFVKIGDTIDTETTKKWLVPSSIDARTQAVARLLAVPSALTVSTAR